MLYQTLAFCRNSLRPIKLKKNFKTLTAKCYHDGFKQFTPTCVKHN